MYTVTDHERMANTDNWSLAIGHKFIASGHGYVMSLSSNLNTRAFPIKTLASGDVFSINRMNFVRVSGK